MVDDSYNPSGHKASEVVELLQKVIAEQGDRPVYLEVDYDDYGHNSSKKGKLCWINIDPDKIVLNGDET